MAKLSTGLDWLLACSILVAILLPLHAAGLKNQIGFHAQPAVRVLVGWFVAGSVLLALLAAALQLPLFPAGLLAFAAGAAMMYLSGLFTAPSLSRGAFLVLLVVLFAVPRNLAEPSAQMQLLGWLTGLLSWKLGASLLDIQSEWDDVLPAGIWLIGTYWMQSAGLLAGQQEILPLILAIALLLNAVQTLEIPIPCRWAKAFLIVLTGSLAAWLAMQTLIPQLPLLPWVLLFSGALLLGFILQYGLEAAPGEPRPPVFRFDAHALMALALIGLATLVASRLYGTVGWLVLAAGMLGVARPNATVAVACLFWLSRSLLQGFVFQYNPNVTGINITHPYASAALYGGLVAMLLLPALLEWLRPPVPSEGKAAWSAYAPHAVFIFGVLVLCGLANFFLHAEATGSLLTALTVGGIGVALLVNRRPEQMLVPLWMIGGCLLLGGLIGQGNEAEKSLKIAVLVATLAVSVLLLWMLQRGRSGKPVEVA